MSQDAMVTVLIPARNEESDIEVCLRAVLAQDHPHERLEIVLVDGGSSDSTRMVARRVLERGGIPWRIIDNPIGATPSNLNVGLAVATGEVTCRVDARSIIPPDYVRRCCGILAGQPHVVVTGGTQNAVCRNASVKSAGIVRALNNKYAMGGSRYRRGASSGPTDTVYLGAFRTEQLRAAGGWDEYFETNQDYELNRRLGRAGTIWFSNQLSVGYLPRESISALGAQYFRFGEWKVRYWKHTGDPPRPRQMVPLVGIFAAIVMVARPTHRLFRRLLFVGAAGAIGAVALDAAGAPPEPAGDGRVRMYSVPTLVTVIAAWSAGVVAGLVQAWSRP